jgi:flagellar protein FlaG
MSAETITTALFLITAVVAAGVLINAVFPVVFNMAGTFQSATHESDVRLRTDFKVVANFATPGDASTGITNIYMKNIGSQKISLDEIRKADVFCGTTVGNRLTYLAPPSNYWQAEILPADNNFWDPGETLHITSITSIQPGGSVYFQFVLPNGVWRSTEFTAEL